MHKKKEKKENSERWLLTYSDLITLLLALFILLFAMSNVDKAKYEELAVSLGGAFGGSTSALPGKSGLLPEAIPDTENGNQAENTDNQTEQESSEDTTTNTQKSEENTSNQEDMDELKDNVDDMISNYYRGNDVTSSIEEDGIVITFSSHIFFDSGDDKIKDEMKLGLKQLALQLNKIDNHVVVEGYTDNVPVNNSRFSSNWQLSAIRAANVVQYLIEEGKVDGSRFSAIGFGENMPIDSNDTEKGRMQNRRIQIMILNH